MPCTVDNLLHELHVANTRCIQQRTSILGTGQGGDRRCPVRWLASTRPIQDAFGEHDMISAEYGNLYTRVMIRIKQV